MCFTHLCAWDLAQGLKQKAHVKHCGAVAVTEGVFTDPRSIWVDIP